MSNERQPIDPDLLIQTKASHIEAYCMLQGFVNQEVFGFSVPSDCFCATSDGLGDTGDNWRSDTEVYDFIRTAVMEKLAGRGEYTVELADIVVTAHSPEAAKAEAKRLLDRDMADILIHDVFPKEETP